MRVISDCAVAGGSKCELFTSRQPTKPECTSQLRYFFELISLTHNPLCLRFFFHCLGNPKIIKKNRECGALTVQIKFETFTPQRPSAELNRAKISTELELAVA